MWLEARGYMEHGAARCLIKPAGGDNVLRVFLRPGKCQRGASPVNFGMFSSPGDHFSPTLQSDRNAPGQAGVGIIGGCTIASVAPRGGIAQRVHLLFRRAGFRSTGSGAEFPATESHIRPDSANHAVDEGRHSVRDF